MLPPPPSSFPFPLLSTSFSPLAISLFPPRSCLQNVALTSDSPALSNFESSSAPLYMYYYFFNVTNPDEVQNNAATPIVTEVGPFAYMWVRQSGPA